MDIRNDIVAGYDNATPAQKQSLEEVKAPFIEKEDEDNDIMSHLNYRKLQKIKEDFMKCEEGLTMD